MIAGDAMYAAQYLAALLGHDDQLGSAASQRLNHRALFLVRRLEHGVERHDDRRVGAIEQLEQQGAGRAAEDAIFVLDQDHVRPAVVDALGGKMVIGDLFLRDRADDLRSVRVGRSAIGHRVKVDRDFREGGRQSGADVVGEGGDTAKARWAVADQGNAVDLNSSGRQSHHRSLMRPIAPALPCNNSADFLVGHTCNA